MPAQPRRAVPSARATARPRAGFTLVELLMVVAILSLLVTILLPSLRRALAMTRLTLCQTNLCSQAKAHALYSADHNDRKPAIMWEQDSRTRWYWTTPNTKVVDQPVGQGILIIREYVVFEALLCRAAAMLEDTALDFENWKYQDIAGSSYEYFWRGPYPEADGSYDLTGDAVTYSHMVNTGRSGLAMDINAEEGNSYYGAGGYGQRIESHPVMGRTNVSYIDGHVSSYDNTEVILRAPGGREERLRWWSQAHSRR